jgi:V-type H+-transporting ATPase subunit a
MFGDILHGALLFIFSTFVCFSERKPGSVMAAFGSSRYLLLLMGFFSAYCGFIYNDMTSIPLKVFGESCYNMPAHTPGVHAEVTIKPDCTYPIGIDPAWYLAKNELTYVNSLKMKMAVIFGVA